MDNPDANKDGLDMDLANACIMIDTLTKEIIKLKSENRKLTSQLKTAYGYGSDIGCPPWIT